MSTKVQMLGRGVVKSQIAKGLSVGLAFLITILLTRWLGPQDYGSYSLILGWISLASLIISMGLSESLNKYIPILITEKTDVVGFFLRVFLLRLGLALGLAIIIRFLVTVVFDFLQHPELIPLADFIIFLFLVYQGFYFLESFFVSQLRIEITIISNTVRQLIVLAGLFYFYFVGEILLDQLLVLIIIGYILAIFIYLYALFQTQRFEKKWELQSFPVILKFGVSVWTVAGVTFLLSEQTDVLLLGYLTTNTSEVAYYKAGTALVWKLIGVITISSPIVLSSLSTKYKREGELGLTKGWQSFIKISTLSIVPLFVFLGWHAHIIIRILYGTDYFVSAVVLQCFVLLTIFPFGLLAGGLHLMTLYTLGQERKGLKIRLISGLLNFVLGIVLIRYFASVGAVIATGLAALIGISMEFYILQRFIKQHYPWRFAFKVLGAVMCSSIVFVLFPVRDLFGLILSGVIYGILILLLLMWWKPLVYEDYLTIVRLNPRLSNFATRFTA